MAGTLTSFLNAVQAVMDYPLHVGKTNFTPGDLILLAGLTVLVFICEGVLRRYVIRRMLDRTHLEPPMRYALARLTGYVFIAIGLYVCLQVAHIDLSGLAVLAGAVGVGLGFGLQNVISNFISGLIILAERPIAIGDRIDVGGVAGRVTKISLRSTTVLTNDNIAIIVPNSNFITAAVTNWNYGDPRVRLRMPIGVAYGSDLNRVRQLLLEVAAEHPQVLRDPAPEVFFNDFGDSALNLELAVWTEEMTSAPRRLRSELNFSIEKKLRENHIEIPFPQRDLHLRSGAWPGAVPPPAPPRATESRSKSLSDTPAVE